MFTFPAKCSIPGPTAASGAKQTRYALKKIASKRENYEKLVKDNTAMDSLINLWLKKTASDSTTRSDVRAFLDAAKSYQKDKMSPETIKKIEDAFKAVRF